MTAGLADVAFMRGPVPAGSVVYDELRVCLSPWVDDCLEHSSSIDLFEVSMLTRFSLCLLTKKASVMVSLKRQ